MLRRKMRLCAALGMGLLAALPSMAQDVRITEDLPRIEILIGTNTVVIERNQDQTAVLEGEFAQTSRACPPSCIQPMEAAPEVETLGELEVIAFLQNHVAAGTGVLMDSRLPEQFGKASIPGAVNVPFATLAPNNPYRDDLLKALGATANADATLDFTVALDVALFCDGAWCDQSTIAILSLLDAGYPADKIHYYRGGMQDWLMMGLSVAVLAEQG